MLLLWLVRFALLAVACTAAVTDLRRRVVPNWLTLPALALGLAAFGLRGGGTGLLDALGGAVIPVAVFGLPWLLGGFGGGDFKMALALGVLGGPVFALQALAWSVVAGPLLIAGWGAAAAVRAWRVAVGAAGPEGSAAAASVKGTGDAPLGTRLRLAASSGWRAVHEAPPPFAVALGAGAVAALAVVVVR